MPSLTFQFHIILLILNLVKPFSNTHWLTYHLKPLRDLFELHAKENALHRINLSSKKQCGVAKLANGKKLCR